MAEIIPIIDSCKNSNFSGVILPRSGIEELFALGRAWGDGTLGAKSVIGKFRAWVVLRLPTSTFAYVRELLELVGKFFYLNRNLSRQD